MKIGIIQQSPDLGGAETYMLNLVNRFIKKGDVIYFATNDGKFLNEINKIKRVEIDNIPHILDIIGNFKGLVKSTLFFPSSLLFYSKLIRKYRKNNIDVILMSGYSEKMLVTVIAKLMGIPTVWIEYGPLDVIFKRNFSLPGIIYKTLDSFPHRIIVPTKNTYKSLSSLGVDKTRLEIIPCGTRIWDITILTEELIIGSVSRLTREKGQQFIIDAMPIVLKKYSNARLHLVGQGPDKEYFENLIEQRKISDHVKFFDYQEDLNQIYKSFRIFVFPTNWGLEGFGLVLIEAMARGIPVIASKHGPIPEIVRDGVDGLLFEKGDSEELAEKIISLLSDKSKLDLLRLSAYKRVKEEYNIDKSAQKIREVLIDAAF